MTAGRRNVESVSVACWSGRCSARCPSSLPRRSPSSTSSPGPPRAPQHRTRVLVALLVHRRRPTKPPSRSLSSTSSRVAPADLELSRSSDRRRARPQQRSAPPLRAQDSSRRRRCSPLASQPRRARARTGIRDGSLTRTQLAGPAKLDTGPHRAHGSVGFEGRHAHAVGVAYKGLRCPSG